MIWTEQATEFNYTCVAIMAFTKQCAFLEVATSKIQFQEFNELKLKIHRVSYKLC